MAPTKKKPTIRVSNSSATVHPPYFQMISEAITSLKDRSGSSQPAIAKFIEENYKDSLPPNFKKVLSVQLKKFVQSEKLVKVSNSYKLSTNAQKEKTVSPSVKESRKKKEGKSVTDEAVTATIAAKKSDNKATPKETTKKDVEKAAKMKRLSQIKTPEALKTNVSTAVRKGGGKTKRLSQLNTPEMMKKTKTVNVRPPTPAPRAKRITEGPGKN